MLAYVGSCSTGTFVTKQEFINRICRALSALLRIEFNRTSNTARLTA